jgi:hypothetical protein
MKEIKQSGFADRLQLQAEAKKAMLAKFKPKPMVIDPDLVDREARKEAERLAVRQARAEVKEAARLAAEEAAAANLDAKRRSIKERKALTASEQKAKRDARYAARKARR